MEATDYKSVILEILDDIITENKVKTKVLCKSLVWYRRAANRNYYWYYTLQVIIFAMGFLSSFLIGMTGPELFANWYWRTFLTILPSLGSLSFGIILQFRVPELWRLRDYAALSLQVLHTDTNAKLLKCENASDYEEIYYDLIAKITKIEKNQRISFIGLWIPTNGIGNNENSKSE
jgi:hypothetical protein